MTRDTGPTALCERCETFVAPENISRWVDRKHRIGICRVCNRQDPVV